MMEKFHEDANEWERRHRNTWLGRHGGTIGTGASAQADLMSPFGVLEFTQDPTLFNLAKAAYTPAIAMGGYSFAGFLSGTRIGFAERLMHSTDMAKRSIHFAAQTAGKSAMFAVRRTPGMIASAALVGMGLYLQNLYHDMSGMYIGDIRFNR